MEPVIARETPMGVARFGERLVERGSPRLRKPDPCAEVLKKIAGIVILCLIGPAAIVGAQQTSLGTMTITNSTPFDFAFELKAQDVIVRHGQRVYAEPDDVLASIAATAVFGPQRLMVPAGRTGSIGIALALPDRLTRSAIEALYRGRVSVSNRAGGAPVRLGRLMIFALADNTSPARVESVASPRPRTNDDASEESDDGADAEPPVSRGVAVILEAISASSPQLSFDSALRMKPIVRRRESTGEPGSDLDQILVTLEFSEQSLTLTSNVVGR